MLRIDLAALGAATALWRSAVLAREEAQLVGREEPRKRDQPSDMPILDLKIWSMNLGGSPCSCSLSHRQAPCYPTLRKFAGGCGTPRNHQHFAGADGHGSTDRHRYGWRSSSGPQKKIIQFRGHTHLPFSPGLRALGCRDLVPLSPSAARTGDSEVPAWPCGTRAGPGLPSVPPLSHL